ncbi:hypothetical protein B1222_04485 [Paenibacillus larvae subsp. pulvifaciens]|uniref:Uncharacterized protein n=1 Tax=Paenibacillus larvae subsp. pulvifaciens TaxID=1477 RepID=A0A1U9YIK4_9BACL|nr:hypothetical protein [Paenibacillus larvae]AQT83824.1 hypothetical protein B1222_04485 [Paenibacillus larvae subsp. pulvifaciens]AQZ45258.1 hypothetical protein B5S25_00310 [Paenibacillus larvae subsp. pulvifaciens]ARF69734.1 hypothetical protein B7C51_20665 [Paenibacillus larvae subsp. pulvifaciens]MBH0343296.1 hypothetical protein [Paenibacillus larvae]MCY7522122.1 hypothetical protein [Paenibacillus larvae]
MVEHENIKNNGFSLATTRLQKQGFLGEMVAKSFCQELFLIFSSVPLDNLAYNQKRENQNQQKTATAF